MNRQPQCTRCGTCALNDIDPRACPDHVLTHIANHKINRIDDAATVARGRQAAHI
jgi:hypothetical protein